MAYLTVKHTRVTKQAADETIRMLFEPTTEQSRLQPRKLK